MSLNVPIVLMVGYRGWTRHGVTTDTVATYTERFLMAFGLNYYLMRTTPIPTGSGSPSPRRSAPGGRS